MCGIVGYTGSECAAPLLIDGLKKLEYRGYDSSGIAVIGPGGLKMVKCGGRLENLIKLTDGGNNIEGLAGVGHTRWATHGEPNDVNSHPHISRSGKFAVVHNGIIENYVELKAFLKERGFEFLSDTDTEVIAHLLEYYYCGDMTEALLKTVNKLSGSYALGVLSCFAPDTVYAVRKDSPLVIGLGKGENFIASDMPAVLKRTRSFLLLEENEIAVLTPGSVSIFDRNRERAERAPFTVDWDVESAEKGGYPHFMLKEIWEQPKAIERTVSPRIKDGAVNLSELKTDREYFRSVKKIDIIACGSAYHAGMAGKYFIENAARLPVSIDLASEYRYRSPITGADTLTIIISQSGETADTLAALREAKRLGSKTLAVVNVVGSSIAREADDVLYTWAGPEIAVATTKGYTSQVCALQLIGIYLARLNGTVSPEEEKRLTEGLKSLPEKIQSLLEQSTEKLQYLSSLYFGVSGAFFIGRGEDYALALEGALKLKEISYIHAESYAAGELKHGTISLIEKGSLVIAVATDSRLKDKTLSNVKEVKTRGAVVVGFVPQGFSEFYDVCDHTVLLPDCLKELSPALTAAALQLFGYYMAAARGCDIDKPRNLAKSVTVE